jgi:hypothetical protein
MALTQTTLAAPCNPGDLRLTLASSAGFLPGQAIRIDSETMYCTLVVNPTVVAVRSRGADGSVAIFHDLGSNVEISGAAGDYGAPAIGESTQIPWYFPMVITLGRAPTTPLVLQNQETIYILAGTAAITGVLLPVVDKAHDGIRLTFTSMSNFAHSLGVTGSALINNGITGGPFGLANFAAFAGATVVFIAAQGKWNVASANGVVIAL